jgi:metal-dependent amidase/aminoacylase/carboxypeptidase family protein
MQMKDRILRQAAGVAELSDAKIHVEFTPGPPSVVNDGGLIDMLRRAAEDVVGAEGIERVARPSMGGEDFACYLDRVPGAMFRLGCATSPGGPFLHSPLFDLDERAVAVGARILARAVVLAAGPRESSDGRDVL